MTNASFTVSSTTLGKDQPLTLQAIPENGKTYHWLFDQGSSIKTSDQEQPPAISFSTVGLHRISLQTENAMGCPANKDVIVLVGACGPNVHGAEILRDNVASDPSSDRVWVQKWGELHSRKGETIYADSAADVYVETGGGLIYAKKGSTIYVNTRETIGVIAELGSSIRTFDSTAHVLVYKCPSIQFDTTTPVLRVENDIIPSEVDCFPNPVSHNLNVRLRNAILKTWIVYDVLGLIKLRGGQLNSVGETISTSNLSSGAYVLRLETSRGQIERRFIVQQ